MSVETICLPFDPKHSLAVLLSKGIDMKRNNDLLRSLLFKIEAETDPIFLHGLTSESSAQDRVEYYHLRLLADAGFVEETGSYGGVFRMTHQGHDFLDAVRSDTRWDKTKEAAANVTGAGIGILRDIAVGYVRQELVKLGLPLG